jgi:glycerate dehydrogenase
MLSTEELKNIKMKIVVLDGYTLNPGDLSWKQLEQLGEVIHYERTPADHVLERAKDAEILLTNKVPVPGEVIRKLPHLKYVGVTATGYNIIDIEAAKEQNVVVTNIPGYSTESVVQLTFALLLELCWHVQRHSDAVMNGTWSRCADFSFRDFPLIELSGKTLGIIGFGTIGQRVADAAAAFGMKVIAYSRTHTDQSHRSNFKWVSIGELLRTVDVISIHSPLTPQTNGLINKEALQQMKPSAFLLNTARGPIIVDRDLADALNNDVIAGAGIDVLSVEPPPADNPLLQAKNCLITPHIAWSSYEARVRCINSTADNISAFLSGKPVNVVN